MTWSDLDTPNLPFKKPQQLEKLEKMSPEERNSMDPYAMEQSIQEVANVIAKTYQTKKIGDFEGCLSLIQSALSEMGNSLGGSFGAVMVGRRILAAEEACRVTFK